MAAPARKASAEFNGSLHAHDELPMEGADLGTGVPADCLPPDDDDELDDMDEDEDEEEEGLGTKRKHGGDSDGGSKKKKGGRSSGGGGGGGDKSNKGLRHFSMMVCNKVEEKARTTYNEVADELVAEFVYGDGASALEHGYDEKNIRRRVYDALNVLLAMDIIAKEKKNITWRGLPTNARQEVTKLQMDADARRQRIEQKRTQLQELLTQQISFKHLITRNRAAGSMQSAETSRVYLPFIIVSTAKETVIDCEMAEDKHDIFFNFSMPFEIHDDNEILKRMGMHNCQLSDLPHLVPPALIPFTPQYQAAQAAQQEQLGNDSNRPAHAAALHMPAWAGENAGTSAAVADAHRVVAENGGGPPLAHEPRTQAALQPALPSAPPAAAIA